jgi:signal transduction histidine kinase
MCNDGELIHICHSGGVMSLSKKTWTIVSSPFKDSSLIGRSINCIHRDSRNMYWICSYGNGLILLDGDGKLQGRYHMKPGQKQELNSELLTMVIEDKNHNIWIGTDGGGLNKVVGNNYIFNRIAVNEHNRYNISDNFIRKLYYSKSHELWVSTLKGINIINEQDSIRYLQLPAPVFFANSPLMATSMAEDKDGNMYIGTETGLYEYKKNRFRMLNVQPSNEVPHANKVLFIFRKKNGELLVSVENSGIFRIRSGSLELINSTYLQASCIYEANDGSFFIHDKASGNHKLTSNLLNEIRLPASLTGLHVNQFLEISPRIIWMATTSGIAVFNEKSNILNKLTGVRSSAGSYIYNLALDHSGNVWFSSNRGLGRISREYPQPHMFDMDDGLQSLEFNGSAFAAAPDGTFYWGGVSGINYFNPDSLFINHSDPRIVLTGLRINESEMDADSIIKNNVITLNYRHNTLAFELASLDLTNPYKNRFSYKLSGVNDNEIYLGAQRVLRFVGLAPGEYTLQIRGTNSNGSWSSHVLKYKIIITPPFYATWWFKGLILVAMLFTASAITLLYRRQKYRQRILELERAREIENIRNRISRDIHDDIGAGLTRISILSEKIKSKVHSGNEEISGILNRISTQSREIVSNLGEIVWAVNPSNDTVDSLISYLRIYAGNFLENSAFEYRFHAPQDDSAYTINPDIRHNVLMVLKESLNNAVKYSRGNMIRINVDVTPAEFYFSISDNGCGIEPGIINGGGNGLPSMKHRMEALAGKLEIRSDSSGTTVSGSVPLHITTF